MIVSLNTATGLNSNSGKAYGNSRQGSARLSAPICDSVSFEGSEAKSPMKSFFKKVGMIGAFAGAAFGFTSCDPTNGPDVPDVKPPIGVNPDANLSAVKKEFKHTFGPVVALNDSTLEGAIHQVKVNDGYSGQDIEYIVDEAKSTGDTIVVKKITSTGDYVESTKIDKFFVDANDKLLTSKEYDMNGVPGFVRKYTKQGNSILEKITEQSAGYKFVPDKIAGQTIKYNAANPNSGKIIKLLTKTMNKL